MWVNTKAKMNQAFKLYFSIGFITPSGMGTCWSMWVCMQPCIGCCLYTWEHSSDCVHWCCCSYRSSAWALGCSSSSSYLMVVAYGTNLLLSTSAMLTPTLTLLAFTLNCPTGIYAEWASKAHGGERSPQISLELLLKNFASFHHYSYQNSHFIAQILDHSWTRI